MNIKFTKIRDVKTPTRGTQFSAGIDLYVPNDYKIVAIPKGQDVIIHSGLMLDMMCQPIALVAFNKSGIATKKKLSVGACVIDSDYQGEILIHLHNNSQQTQCLKPGEKIVQVVALPVLYPELIETNDVFLTKTERGGGRMGSTGID